MRRETKMSDTSAEVVNKAVKVYYRQG
jgi:hypothetical protein